MTRRWNGILCWTPRILTICFAIFLSLFATDVLSENLGFWQAVADLAMHLIPVGIVLAILAMAWRWEWVGAALFAAAAMIYSMWALPRHWDWVAMIALPPLVIAGLYLLAWMVRDRGMARGTDKMAH